MKAALRIAKARPTLLTGAAILLAVTPLLHAATPFDWTTSGLLAWCLATLIFVLVGGWRLSGNSREQLQKIAAAIDSSALAILVIAIAVAVASLVAVVVELVRHTLRRRGAGLHAGLRARWTRRAHRRDHPLLVVLRADDLRGPLHPHLLRRRRGRDGPKAAASIFAGETEPLFSDFVYFSVSVGATSQTSDTAVPSPRMRRIVTAHAIFAFFFNTTILALTINIAAGLVG